MCCQLRIQYQMLSDMIEYFQGDGESLPDTPPNETAAAADPAVKIANKASHPFSLDIKVQIHIQHIQHCTPMFSLRAPNLPSHLPHINDQSRSIPPCGRFHRISTILLITIVLIMIITFIMIIIITVTPTTRLTGWQLVSSSLAYSPGC